MDLLSPYSKSIRQLHSFITIIKTHGSLTCMTIIDPPQAGSKLLRFRHTTLIRLRAVMINTSINHPPGLSSCLTTHWLADTRVLQCDGGRSGPTLGSGGGIERGQPERAWMGGTTPKLPLLRGCRHGRIIRPGLGVGVFQHPGRAVWLSGPTGECWEDGRNCTPSLLGIVYPVGGGIWVADEGRGGIIPREAESQGEVFRLWGVNDNGVAGSSLTDAA